MQKAIEIQSRGLTLRGMLHTPNEYEGKIPIVCIFHGFTGNKMEPHFIFVKLSRTLEKLGIASIRMDFGDSGESDGEFSNMTLSNELEDAKVILEYVKKLSFVDNQKIGVVGLSMGGAVSALLSGTCHNDIKSLCLWAPAGNIVDVAKDYINTQENKDKEYYDIGGLALGKGFIEDVKKLDLQKDIELFKGNVLILHGDKDETVPLKYSDPYLNSYENAKRIVITNGDHTFNSLTTEKKVISLTTEFLKDELN